MSIKDHVMETKVERAGDQWLVSTPKHEAVMSYGQHDTATQMQLPNQTVFIKVPQGTVVHIDDIVLHHLHSEDYSTDVEAIDALRGHNFTIEDTLRQQLLSEGTKVVQFSLDQSGFHANTLSPLARTPINPWSAIAVAALGLTLCGWIITALIAARLLNYIQTLHNKLNTLTNVPDRFRNRPCGVLSLPSARAAIELPEM